MRRASLTLLVLAATLGAAASAHAAAWLTPPETLSTGGGDASAPLRAVADPGKDLFLAWKRGDVIEVGVRPAGGSFGLAQLYGCPPSTFCSSAHDPDVAVDADGNSIVVFVLDGLLRAFERTAGGSYAQLPDITSAVNVSQPLAEFMPDGTAIVVWRQENSGLLAAERPPGGSFGAPIPIHAESGGEEVGPNAYALATGGAGSAIVAFATEASSASTTTARLKTVYRAPAGWEGTQQVAQKSVSSDLDCLRSIAFVSPAVVLDRAANAAAATRIFLSSTNGPGVGCGPEPPIQTRVLAARRPADVAWLPPVEFENSSTNAGDAPALAFTSAGEAVAAWGQTAVGGSSMRYVVGPAGSFTFGAAATVPGSATASGDLLTDPQLVPLAEGGTLLGFIRQSGVDWSIAYSLRPAGAPFGATSPATTSAQVLTRLKLGATPAGDVAATWLQDDDAGNARVRSLIYDASPPTIADVNVPASGEVGGQLAMSASATDAFSPVTFGWAFGDGATAPGAATTHAYGATGSFDVTLTATDAAANSSTATRTTAIAVDPSPEFLGGIVLANARLRAAARGASAIPTQRRRRRVPIGTRVTFRLSEAASVRFTVERARAGRRVRGRCVKPTRRNRQRRKCTRYVRQRGSFTVPAGAGETRFRFTGRLRARKLRPARYRLVAVATDETGKRSAPTRASFTIVR